MPCSSAAGPYKQRGASGAVIQGITASLPGLHLKTQIILPPLTCRALASRPKCQPEQGSFPALSSCPLLTRGVCSRNCPAKKSEGCWGHAQEVHPPPPHFVLRTFHASPPPPAKNKKKHKTQPLYQTHKTKQKTKQETAPTCPPQKKQKKRFVHQAWQAWSPLCLPLSAASRRLWRSSARLPAAWWGQRLRWAGSLGNGFLVGAGGLFETQSWIATVKRASLDQKVGPSSYPHVWGLMTWGSHVFSSIWVHISWVQLSGQG